MEAFTAILTGHLIDIRILCSCYAGYLKILLSLTLHRDGFTTPGDMRIQFQREKYFFIVKTGEDSPHSG